MRGLVRLVICLFLLAGGTCETLWADSAQMFLKIISRKQASFGDGCLAVLSLAGEPNADGLKAEEALGKLVQKGIVPAKWTIKVSDNLTRGKLAYMVCKACSIKGGVNLHLFGATERYAYKECVYLSIMAAGNESRTLSGSELMAVIRRAGEHLAGNNFPMPAGGGSSDIIY